MKKLALVLSVIMLAALIMSLPVSAADYKVLVGTPELDGVLDDIYLQSANYTVTTADAVYTSGADYADVPEFAATTYFLHDLKYLYMCTVVTDAKVVSVGESTIKANGEYTWQNDVTELWYSYNGSDWAQFNYDAFGLQLGMSTSFGLDRGAGYDGRATITDTGYITEVRLPLIDMNYGSTIYQNTQVNNIVEATAASIVCIGSQKGTDHLLTLSDQQVEIIVEVDDEEVDEAATEDVAAAEAPKTSAKTADAAVLLAVVGILGSGIVVSKKH